MGSCASSSLFFLAMWFLAFVASPVMAASDEAAALLSFKLSSVEVDPRNSLHSWDGGGDPCSWFGVTCSGTDRRVQSLDLRNLGLAGRLGMDDLMALQGLREVNLHGNFFYGNLSHSLAAPSPTCAFEVVDLSSNNFSEAVAARFLASCNSLVSLTLSRNSITGGVHPFPPSIRTLDLSHNRISDEGLLNYSLAGGCSRGLSYLNMSDNKLSGSLQGVSAACGNLVVLDLSYNLFSGGIPPGFMMALPASLNQMSLSQNNFSGDFSGFQFGPCDNLTVMDLSHCCV